MIIIFLFCFLLLASAIKCIGLANSMQNIAKAILLTVLYVLFLRTVVKAAFKR